MTDASNPFAAPQSDLNAVVPEVVSPPDAEAIRRELIGHEVSAKSIGTLYYLGAILTGLFAVVGATVLTISFLAGDGPGSAGSGETVIIGGVVFFYGVLSAISFILARGLRRLNPRVRVPTGILCAIGLLAFPLGTLINAYFLYLLFSKKGRRVFSPEYREIIRQTPHIRYQTSIIVWIALFLLLALIAAAIVAAAVGR
jgi:hypothetical protein